MDYQTWRKELHELQIRIDNLEDAYYGKEDFSDDAKAKFNTERKTLCDELETMYQNTPEQN
ncbi:hypothetical protein PP914_gp068 [Arthrobacter phage Qui]|uniref:Uncharacterized protein n=1 Tax=Arthrobacter phage Qui TaxID=2603260 RepID=A0A5B8WPF6_9CAUD|nr:hypothetical protein PP914_gp068 [Arthrobacter phage Qui]QED11558.1 hypothetical protein SEA_QUI_68 [Arthrobacter phage Qui]QOC56390.1 hypothetical protein SEA_PAELLA_68 [Arthrobacter phage Paella]